MSYRNETTKKLQFLLWASLQDVQQYKDIIDRSKASECIKRCQENIARTEKEISAIRAELKRREHNNESNVCE